MQDVSAETATPAPLAHAASADEAARALSTDLSSGLTSAEAERRLARYGPNALPEAQGRNIVQAFAEQFANFLILL